MRIAVLIDGGHLRVLARRAGHTYNPDFIEELAHTCVRPEESLLRVLYYDCAPYEGTVRLPVSDQPYEFKGSDAWLRDLASRDLFAVRRGVLKFRGWTAKHIPLPPQLPKDQDFKPNFEQKGVDMRIGLDVATYSASRVVDRIALLTGDTDCAPAMKHARIAGLQVVLIALPNHRSANELRWHSDFERQIDWPKSSAADAR